MQIMADALSHTTIGQPVSFGNLTMFPLLNGGKEIADYLTLDDAIKQGQAIIIEVSEIRLGTRPDLNNKGNLAVLLVDGEELIGAKQNRILNLTILAPAHRKFEYSSFMCGAGTLELQVSRVRIGTASAVRLVPGEQALFGFLFVKR